MTDNLNKGHRAFERDFGRPAAPEGWTIEPTYVGYSASHRDFDASYEGEEDGWVGNGLSAWGRTREECLAAIADIEAEHPHFADAGER